MIYPPHWTYTDCKYILRATFTFTGHISHAALIDVWQDWVLISHWKCANSERETAYLMRTLETSSRQKISNLFKINIECMEANGQTYFCL